MLSVFAHSAGRSHGFATPHTLSNERRRREQALVMETKLSGKYGIFYQQGNNFLIQFEGEKEKIYGVPRALHLYAQFSTFADGGRTAAAPGRRAIRGV